MTPDDRSSLQHDILTRHRMSTYRFGSRSTHNSYSTLRLLAPINLTLSLFVNTQICYLSGFFLFVLCLLLSWLAG